ncbi:hypothetical protein [Mycobacterium intracellulare]|uniref:hypothetical protein n=1 Tax=Mycobacterium TaxID=1763 RepID=UPI001E5CBBA4|nr:hypothetical protein [Mycobacterium intracellulare]
MELPDAGEFSNVTYRGVQVDKMTASGNHHRRKIHTGDWHLAEDIRRRAQHVGGM